MLGSLPQLYRNILVELFVNVLGNFLGIFSSNFFESQIFPIGIAEGFFLRSNAQWNSDFKKMIEGKEKNF